MSIAVTERITDAGLRKVLLLAGEVQRSLQPRPSPNVVGLDIAGRNLPFDEVGGDLYDFIWNEDNPEGPVSIVVGDVSGHGADSAILAARASGYLRMGGLAGLSMDRIIATVNRDLIRSLNGSGWFMTLFYLTFSADRKSVEWIRAGHNSALLYDPRLDTFTSMRGNGTALGLDGRLDFETNSLSGLLPGQVVIIGTDGLCESWNGLGEMFGCERVKDAIRENAPRSAQEMVNAVFDAHAEFTTGMGRLDDLTLVAVKIL